MQFERCHICGQQLNIIELGKMYIFSKLNEQAEQDISNITLRSQNLGLVSENKAAISKVKKIRAVNEPIVCVTLGIFLMRCIDQTS